MYKLKEFKGWETNSHNETVNDFIEKNNIKDFEVAGYQLVWEEGYIPYTIILIKYWEENNESQKETNRS